MGYTANSVDTDFTVPADKVPDALAALNASITDDPEGAGYTSLAAAVDEHGGFSDSDDPGDDINYDGFRLGFHTDSWWWEAAESVLTVLAPFATEGSYVRLIGEDDCLFGFRVVDGQLRTETGDFTWTLDGVQSTSTAPTWSVGDRVSWAPADPNAAGGEIVQVGGDYTHNGKAVHVGIKTRPWYWVYWDGIDRSMYPPVAYSSEDLATPPVNQADR
jgi:hypothetical protein